MIGAMDRNTFCGRTTSRIYWRFGKSIPRSLAGDWPELATALIINKMSWTPALASWGSGGDLETLGSTGQAFLDQYLYW